MKPSNLEELYDALRVHDWYYMMSDDGQKYLAGFHRAEELRQAAVRIEGGEALFQMFHRHYFGPGSPFAKKDDVGERQPLPPRPEAQEES